MNDYDRAISDLKIIIQRKAEYAATLDPDNKQLPQIEVELKVFRRVIKTFCEFEKNTANSINGLLKIRDEKDAIIDKFITICFLHGIDNFENLLSYPSEELIHTLKVYRIEKTFDGKERILQPYATLNL